MIEVTGRVCQVKGCGRAGTLHQFSAGSSHHILGISESPFLFPHLSKRRIRNFSALLKKNPIKYALWSLLSLILQNFDSVTTTMVPPHPPCWEPASAATSKSTLVPPRIGRGGGQSTWDTLVPPRPGLKGSGHHFAWLIQAILPLGTACRAQRGETALLITLKSSLWHLVQKSINYAPASKSLVGSGHFFFQLRGLRDYCESSP